MSIECPQCSSFNASGALHCDQCGASLSGRGGSGSKGVPPLVVGILLLLVGGGAFLFFGSGSEPAPSPNAREPVASERGMGGGTSFRESPGRAATPDLTEPAGELLAQDAAVASGRLVAGWLQLEDPHGDAIDRIATAATRGGWIAVPYLCAMVQVRLHCTWLLATVTQKF